MINILEICSNSIDPMFPNFTSILIKTIRYIVPVILIILGILDLVKAIISTDSAKMKSSVGLFIRRIIYSLLIYFMVAIVQFIVNTLGRAGAINKNKANACIECFVNNENCGSTIETNKLN